MVLYEAVHIEGTVNVLFSKHLSGLPDGDELPCTAVRDVVLGHVFSS